MGSFKQKKIVQQSGINDSNGVTLAEHLLSENPHPNANMGGSGGGSSDSAVAQHNADPSAHSSLFANHRHSSYDTDIADLKNIIYGDNGLKNAVEGLLGAPVSPGTESGGSNINDKFSDEYEVISASSLAQNTGDGSGSQEDDEESFFDIRINGFNALDNGKWAVCTELDNAPESGAKIIFVEVTEIENEVEDGNDVSSVNGLGKYVIFQRATVYPGWNTYVRLGHTATSEQITKKYDENDPTIVVDEYPNSYTYGAWSLVSSANGGSSGGSGRGLTKLTGLVELTADVNQIPATQTNLVMYDQLIMLQYSDFDAFSNGNEYALPPVGDIPIGAYVKYILFGGPTYKTVTFKCSDDSDTRIVGVSASKNIAVEFMVVHDGTSKKWAYIN